MMPLCFLDVQGFHVYAVSIINANSIVNPVLADLRLFSILLTNVRFPEYSSHPILHT